MSKASDMKPGFGGFESEHSDNFVNFSHFLPNFKGLYLLSAKFRDLQSLNSAKIESKRPLETFRTHKVLQVLFKNDL